jgi:uncharacterized surface protein with fasciclin (FAS1) repeats
VNEFRENAGLGRSLAAKRLAYRTPPRIAFPVNCVDITTRCRLLPRCVDRMSNIIDNRLMKKKLVIAIGLVSAALAFSGCKKKSAQDPVASKSVEGSAAQGSAQPLATAAAVSPATKTVIETAKAAGSFTTFLKAVDAAGIADKLNGAGPFTVFAPTDDAFAKIPQKDLDALLADKTKLEAVLQYHVVAGNLLAKDLSTATTEKSVEGADLAIDASSGVKVAGATVVKPDLVATNGVIHGIDTVLTPPAK